MLLQISVNRNPDVIISAFVSSQPRHPPTDCLECASPNRNNAMSGSSNITAMRKMVQQLRFEASINRVKVTTNYFLYFKWLLWSHFPLLHCANAASSCNLSLVLVSRALFRINVKFQNATWISFDVIIFIIETIRRTT